MYNCECGTNKRSEGILTHESVMTFQIKIFIRSSENCDNGCDIFFHQNVHLFHVYVTAVLIRTVLKSLKGTPFDLNLQ